MKLLSFIWLFLSCSTGYSLPPQEIQLYQERRFTELEHKLIVRNQISILNKIIAQEKDLRGCRNLRNGKESVDSLLQCASFINRERGLGIKSNGGGAIIDDLKILCTSMIHEPKHLEKIAQTQVFRDPAWSTCNDKAWEQVYLTTYANFETNPARCLSLVRKAQKGLGAQSKWAQKTMFFLKNNSKN